jgi:hypothetical protein
MRILLLLCFLADAQLDGGYLRGKLVGKSLHSADELDRDGGNSVEDADFTADERMLQEASSVVGLLQLLIYCVPCCVCAVVIKNNQDNAKKRYDGAPISYLNMTQATVVGQPAAFGQKFDSQTGESIPKFDPNTGAQNW